MIKIFTRLFFVGLLLTMSMGAKAWDEGIYLTQYTLENTDRLNYLIKRSKEVGINTFVVDIERIDPKYDKNIALIKANNLKYVARVIMFPGGGTDDQVHSIPYREKKYLLVDHAIKLGAESIQLDYIRYDTHRPADPRYAQDIHNVIKWFKTRVQAQNVPLQIDVFGETCYAPSRHIGQDLTVLADTVDDVNPMVYPSHYWPFQEHSKHPYDTIYSSLTSIYDQFDSPPPFKVHAFIEASNYHYHYAPAVAQQYIRAELKAVRDSKEEGNIQGWYAWSAHNQYDNLFDVLANKQSSAQEDVKKPAQQTLNKSDNAKDNDS